GSGAISVIATVIRPANDVDHAGIAFGAPPGERQLGFGERSNAVDQRGNTVENYVAEGPYQPDERPFIAGFVPPAGYHPRDDATYFPMPWLLSTRGYGFLLDGGATSNFRLGTDQPGAWSAEVEGSDIAFRVFAGAGLAVTAYFNPMICTSYHPVWDQAVAQNVVTKNQLGQPYTYKYTGSTVFLVGQMDFTAPRAQPFWNRLLGEAVGNGYDGWMEDFGEYTPTDARSADGTPGPQMHNLYPALYHRASLLFAQTAPRPLARF